MKKIYFHIDELARDAVVASALIKHLKSSNVEIFFGNRRISKFFNKFNINFPFDLAIFPSVDLLQSSFGRPENINFPVIILPTESISGTENTLARQIQHLFGGAYAVNGMDDWVKKINKFCLWGQAHKLNLINTGLEVADLIEVVGHPRYDKLCYPKYLAKKQSSKKSLGLISRFDLINIFDGRSNLKFAYQSRKIDGRLEYNQSKNRDIEDYYHNSILDLRIFFNILDKINFQDWEVSIRVHPRENRKNWEELALDFGIPIEVSSWDRPFSHWLLERDIVIAPPSTSFYDAALLNKKAISIGQVTASRARHANEFMDDFDPIFKYFPSPKSIDELLEEIDREETFERGDNGLDELLMKEVNYPECINSLKETAKIINNILSPLCEKRNIKGLILIYILREIDAAINLISNKLRGIAEQSANFSLGFRRRIFISKLSQDASD